LSRCATSSSVRSYWTPARRNGPLDSRLPPWRMPCGPWHDRPPPRRLLGWQEVSVEVHDRVRAQLLQAVEGVDHPDGAALGAHHDRLGVRAAAAVSHTAQEVAVGDSGCGEEDVVPANQVVGVQHAIQVVALGDRLLPLLLIARPQLRLNGAANALEGTGSDDALRRAADADQNVHIRLLARGVDGARDVAVSDEADPGTGLPDLLDQRGVPRSVQNAHRQLGDA